MTADGRLPRLTWTLCPPARPSARNRLLDSISSSPEDVHSDVMLALGRLTVSCGARRPRAACGQDQGDPGLARRLVQTDDEESPTCAAPKGHSPRDSGGCPPAARRPLVRLRAVQPPDRTQPRPRQPTIQREDMSGGLVHGVQGGGGHAEARAAGVPGAHGSPPPPSGVDIPETGGGQEQRSGGGRRQAPTEPRRYVGDLSYRRESTTTTTAACGGLRRDRLHRLDPEPRAHGGGRAADRWRPTHRPGHEDALQSPRTAGW